MPKLSTSRVVWDKTPSTSEIALTKVSIAQEGQFRSLKLNAGWFACVEGLLVPALNW